MNMESFTPNDYIALMKKQLDGGTLTDEENKILEIGAKRLRNKNCEMRRFMLVRQCYAMRKKRIIVTEKYWVTIIKAMDKLIAELLREGALRNPLVLSAFTDVDRADFVLPKYRAEAYQNYPLPIGYGQTISQPYTVAFMMDLLDPKPGHKILEAGSGCGWQTAMLAHIVGVKGKHMRDGDNP